MKDGYGEAESAGPDDEQRAEGDGRLHSRQTLIVKESSRSGECTLYQNDVPIVGHRLA